MKILHTSDWHLGQTLYGRRRYDEFRRFLNWLTQTLRDENVDVLLVSGDIFDSGMPSNQAQALYYDFLRKAAQGACRHVVITAGNHDSPSFLDAPQALLRALNVHVVGGALSPEEEVLLLSDAEGRPELIVCAVPFLRDRDLYRATAGDTVEERDRLLAEGMREHYRRSSEEAERLRRTATATSHTSAGALPLSIVAMGHLYTAGGSVAEGDGVRDLRIGSLGQIDASIFPPSFDYVALGHLHIAQRVDGQDRIRYSGSPIPMGFGEADQQKKVFIVEWEGSAVSVRGLDVPLFQKLKKVQGDLPDIEKRLEELSMLGESVWLEVLYTGSAVVSDLRERLLEKASSSIEILRVRTLRGLEASLTPEREEALDDLSLEDVFERRLDDAERLSGLTADQREALRNTYREALHDYFQNKDEGREGGEACAS